MPGENLLDQFAHVPAAVAVGKGDMGVFHQEQFRVTSNEWWGEEKPSGTFLSLLKMRDWRIPTPASVCSTEVGIPTELELGMYAFFLVTRNSKLVTRN